MIRNISKRTVTVSTIVCLFALAALVSWSPSQELTVIAGGSSTDCGACWPM